ncbi:suppressor of hpr1 [Rhodotorula mucilaginosa]|uniref:Mediator of RNA polymerase II transcription subunit 31 n=1 Tax=Rhodotorula mucilaginosa TaxID=5537 RepID=A0A9P7B6L0_RHOMI|nr:suppressor of hpr1 [Rhodotorula mucilaginosa]
MTSIAEPPTTEATMSGNVATTIAPATVTQVPTPAERDANRIRFETELEFVQCLANPFYLQCRSRQLLSPTRIGSSPVEGAHDRCGVLTLAQQGLFDQPTFLNYLRYLLYFRDDPRYSRFLQYPSSLEHLSLLTAPDPAGQSFRNAWSEQPLMAQEWAGKMVARWAEWRERETLLGGGGNGSEAGSGSLFRSLRPREGESSSMTAVERRPPPSQVEAACAASLRLLVSCALP